MAARSDAVASITDEQRTLLMKLASLTEMAEQYRATIFMLERERMQLMTKLRLSGYPAPAEQGIGG